MDIIFIKHTWKPISFPVRFKSLQKSRCTLNTSSKNYVLMKIREKFKENVIIIFYLSDIIFSKIKLLEK